MTSTVHLLAIPCPPAEPRSRARTVVIVLFVALAHLALFAVYSRAARSGVSGLREAHAVAPTGPLEVVLLAAPSAVEPSAPAGPPSHASIRPHLSPPARRALARKPAPADAVAPAPLATAPRKVVVTDPTAATAGAASTASAAASSASAAKALSAAEAARSSARPETKRSDEVVCRIPTPAYPARARRLEEEGTATVRMTLDTSGRPTAVSLEQGTGFADLDAAALDAVRSAVCEPYIKQGEAVPVSVVQSIDFKLAPQ